MKKNIHIQNLIEFGFSDTEAVIIELLSKKPQSRVTELASNLGIARSTIHDNVYSLANRGYLRVIKGPVSDRFELSDPQIYFSQIIDEKEKLDLKEEKITNFLNSIKTSSFDDLKSDIRFYEGVAGLEQVIWNSLRAKDAIIGPSVWGRNDIVRPSFYKEYLKAVKEKSVIDRSIINPTKETLAYVKQTRGGAHHVKNENIRVVSNKIFKIYGDTMVYNDVVAQLFWKENEIFGFEIENRYYASMQKQYFENLWNIGESIDKYIA